MAAPGADADAVAADARALAAAADARHEALRAVGPPSDATLRAGPCRTWNCPASVRAFSRRGVREGALRCSAAVERAAFLAMPRTAPRAADLGAVRATVATGGRSTALRNLCAARDLGRADAHGRALAAVAGCMGGPRTPLAGLARARFLPNGVAAHPAAGHALPQQDPLWSGRFVLASLAAFAASEEREPRSADAT